MDVAEPPPRALGGGSATLVGFEVASITLDNPLYGEITLYPLKYPPFSLLPPKFKM
jgi:hypothetical protein